MSVREIGESRREHRSQCDGVEALIGVAARRGREAPARRTRVGAQTALLCAPVHAQEVGRDSVQPRQRGLAATIKTTSAAKGACERLSGELLREGFSDPPTQVAIDCFRVAIKHGLEELGPLK